jgi:YidC/Oxa1 family membrane protein insertase
MFAAIGHFFHIILIQPLVNLLVLGYHYLPGHNVGWVIVLITILVRVILAPSMNKALRNQRSMSALQPKINELREKHKGDQAAQAQALMALYKEHNFNPLSSLLPTLVQLPLLLALYRVFVIALGNNDLGSYLYHWVANPGVLSPIFIFGLNLAKVSWILGVVAGVLQFFQSRLMFSKMQKSNDPTQNAMQTQTLYVLPALTIIISLRVPAGLPLYWITTTLFAIGQQWLIFRSSPSDKVQVIS